MRIFVNGIEIGPIGDDWQPGNLAECIFEGRWLLTDGSVAPFAGPVKDEVRRVEAVDIRKCCNAHPAVIFLRFARYGNAFFDARCFRKITPRAEEALAADTAFVRELTGSDVPIRAIP